MNDSRVNCILDLKILKLKNYYCLQRTVSNIIKFNKGDLFFESLLAFFSSYIVYHLLFAPFPVNSHSGRLRGQVIPQIKFDTPIPGILKKRQEVTDIEFELDYTDPGPVQGEIIKSTPLTTFWIQQMLGHSYEISKPNMEQKFGSDVMKWPPELQFFRHIRNGCFHKNIFNIKKKSISTQVMTEWRGKKIMYNDNKKQVLLTFIGIGDAIVLLYDIQELLK